MTTATVRLERVLYNPELGVYEALAHIRDGGEMFVYPVRFAAPIATGFRSIAGGLVREAESLHRAAWPGLRLRRAATTTQQALAA